jgi:hypothetical protein
MPARHAPRWKQLLCLSALPMLQACAARADMAAATGRAAPPRLLVASPESRVGGEARYEGVLRVENGCVVVVADGRRALPIFDASVALEGGGGAIVDGARNRRVALGERLRASAAYLREDGTGWSVADVERLTGVQVPAGCGNTLLRLRTLEPIAG